MPRYKGFRWKKTNCVENSPSKLLGLMAETKLTQGRRERERLARLLRQWLCKSQENEVVMADEINRHTRKGIHTMARAVKFNPTN